MASLYLYNPGEFWATIDKVDHHFQPLGANMLWPNFQVRGIIFYILESIQDLMVATKVFQQVPTGPNKSQMVSKLNEKGPT